VTSLGQKVLREAELTGLVDKFGEVKARKMRGSGTVGNSGSTT